MYRVLYRKWRPQTFSDVVGQSHITDTILSQINENRVSHAYLFTGSRGTGKTTCAKIFAKAVNCLNPVNGEPCNECEICKSIDNGSNLDVVEMDAASNRNLDDIKDVLQEVLYPPSRSKYRVYIIDEVHMLTTFAFNALLKTLEEPPEYVRFILATTEVQKMPATVLSRCQRFDFRRIEPDVIADRLSYVAEQEGGSIDRDAGEYIAKIADGGMRDSLSLLDRCLSISNNVTSEIVASSAGLIGREYLYDLIRAVGAKDTAKCLNIIDGLHKNSCDTERLCTDIIGCFRNFLVLKTVDKPENLIVCTKSELETIKETAKLFSEEYIIFALGVLSDAAESLRFSASRRTEAEMAFIKLCRPDSVDGTQALLARIAALEEEIELLKSTALVLTSEECKHPEPIVVPPSYTENNSSFSSSVNSTNDIKKVEEKSKPASPFSSAVATPSAKEPFSGFEAALSQSAPSVFDDEETDDEVFDFEKFMSENSSVTDDKPAVTESSDFDDEFFPDPDSLVPPEESDYVPSVPADYYEDEKPFSSSAEIKKEVSQPVQSGGASVIDAKTWRAFIKKVEQSQPMVIGMLADSVATLGEGSLIIRLKNEVPMPKPMIIANIKNVNDALTNGRNIVIE